MMIKHVKTFESFLNEKKPAGAPDWKDSDAPDAKGRFRDLGIKDLADWLIKTRKGDLKKISGSLTQQIVFNRKDDPKYAEKMEKVRREVYKKLDREDLLENTNELLEEFATSGANSIVFGNPPIEYIEIIKSSGNRIKEWFIEEGLADAIISGAPANDSETTMVDLQTLLEKTSRATAEEIQFARYVESVDHLAQSFVDLLKEHGIEITMGDFFSVDSQTEGLLHFLKNEIDRPRPNQLAKYYGLPLFPLVRTDAMNASYPSGHALTGFVMSEYFATKYPQITTQMRAHGERIAESRELTGIHYPSDTKVSREICKIIMENNLLKEY